MNGGVLEEVGRRGTNPGRSLRLNLAVALLSGAVTAVVLFCGAEVWLRLTKPHMTPETERQGSLQYEASLFSRHVLARMPQTLRSSDGRVMAYINALGYRGRSFVIPKLRYIRRVVVLGGSGAFDPHAVAGHDWPHLTERYLRHSGHRNVEVINAGVPGHATWDLLGRLYGDIWTIGPDYVVVYEA